MKIDVDKFAGMVTGSSGGAAILQNFGLDTTTYAWVKYYVRDKKMREEIQSHQQRIIDAQAQLIDKEELKRMFLDRVDKLNDIRIQQLIEHLGGVQKRERPLLNENMLGSIKILGTHLMPCFMEFTSEDTERIFSNLPEGAKQKDIDSEVKSLQKKIRELEEVISKELSPRDRWFHRDNGIPEPYPQGCRWTPFVEVWRKVAARFEGGVDIEGYSLKTSSGVAAFGLLGLDRVRKIMPLREPIK